MRSFAKKTVRILAIIAGLYGGWLAAGALNDRRADVPRMVAPSTRPATQP